VRFMTIRPRNVGGPIIFDPRGRGARPAPAPATAP